MIDGWRPSMLLESDVSFADVCGWSSRLNFTVLSVLEQEFFSPLAAAWMRSHALLTELHTIGAHSCEVFHSLAQSYPGRSGAVIHRQLLYFNLKVKNIHIQLSWSGQISQLPQSQSGTPVSCQALSQQKRLRNMFCTGISEASNKHSPQGQPGSVPDGMAPGFSHVGIVPDDAAGLRVFPEISCFSRPFISALLHAHLASPLSAPKFSMLRAAKISSLTHSNKHYQYTKRHYTMPDSVKACARSAITAAIPASVAPILTFHALCGQISYQVSCYIGFSSLAATGSKIKEIRAKSDAHRLSQGTSLTQPTCVGRHLTSGCEGGVGGGRVDLSSQESGNRYSISGSRSNSTSARGICHDPMWRFSKEKFQSNQTKLAVGIGIVPDDAAGRRVFSGVSHPLTPFFILALLHTHLNHPRRLLRATLISSLHFSGGIFHETCYPSLNASRYGGVYGITDRTILSAAQVEAKLSHPPDRCQPSLLRAAAGTGLLSGAVGGREGVTRHVDPAFPRNPLPKAEDGKWRTYFRISVKKIVGYDGMPSEAKEPATIERERERERESCGDVTKQWLASLVTEHGTALSTTSNGLSTALSTTNSNALSTALSTTIRVHFGSLWVIMSHQGLLERDVTAVGGILALSQVEGGRTPSTACVAERAQSFDIMGTRLRPRSRIKVDVTWIQYGVRVTSQRGGRPAPAPSLESVALEHIPFLPPLHSGAARYSSHFILVGSQNLDIESSPDLFTHSLTAFYIEILKSTSFTTYQNYTLPGQPPYGDLHSLSDLCVVLLIQRAAHRYVCHLHFVAPTDQAVPAQHVIITDKLVFKTHGAQLGR
ncbi:hypothetical protein PR048_022124 [Dryococelus australis]|uniref:Uncharacterized protein n=1 Tax=Dryococelus australis TaxID=614101 RepID=A0ABQ9H049_9NEOP|nr:hypothetical protein PR048_022124 [Dryococelus australis]